MQRREFLRAVSAGCLGMTLRAGSASAQAPPGTAADDDPLKGVMLIDAHAHPDQLAGGRRVDLSSTLKSIKAVGMSASSFSAVGDSERSGVWSSRTLNDVLLELDRVKRLAEYGQVKLVLTSQDIPGPGAAGNRPGAILCIEGGNPLRGDPSKVDECRDYGVRLITLLHYSVNELGDCMTARPHHNGLTPAGRKVVQRMEKLGLVVDVAHAHSNTLRSIVEIAEKPLIDSHTSPCPQQDSSRCGRLRAWEDMELIAKTGGVICLWPLAYQGSHSQRETLRDWAQDVPEMKKRLGIEHVGLGTDGGGQLPGLVKGYHDVTDLRSLGASLRDAGLSRDDIAAFLGGNFYRVFKQCAG